MLIFEDKLPTTNRTAIINKINAVATSLGINPNWLMAVINFETAGTFSPSIQNPFSNATGLIQFIPSTAEGLGTSVESLKQMSFIQQLDFVERYYRPWKSRVTGFVDLYLATFYPLAIGKADNYVIGSHNGTSKIIADQNPAFNDGGQVTVASIKKSLLTKIPAQYLSHLVESNSTSILGIGVAAVVGFFIYKWYKKKYA